MTPENESKEPQIYAVSRDGKEVKFNRRNFLEMATATAVVATVAGCGPDETPTETAVTPRQRIGHRNIIHLQKVEPIQLVQIIRFFASQGRSQLVNTGNVLGAIGRVYQIMIIVLSADHFAEQLTAYCSQVVFVSNNFRQGITSNK